MLKRILNIAIWLLLFSGLIVTLGFVNQEQGASPCRAIDIAIGKCFGWTSALNSQHQPDGEGDPQQPIC
jgi:hypothetical protein